MRNDYQKYNRTCIPKWKLRSWYLFRRQDNGSNCKWKRTSCRKSSFKCRRFRRPCKSVLRIAFCYRLDFILLTNNTPQIFTLASMVLVGKHVQRQTPLPQQLRFLFRFWKQFRFFLQRWRRSFWWRRSFRWLVTFTCLLFTLFTDKFSVIFKEWHTK